MREIVFAALLLMHVTTPAAAQQTVPFAGDRVVTILTRNVYAGVDAEIAALVTATDLPDLLQKVAAVYQGYFTRNFPERAAALAREVEATRPAVIGLQEAVLVRTQSPPDGPATPATTIALDFVNIFLNALAAHGLRYEVAVQSNIDDAELPSAFGFDVRQTERNVILVRSDLQVSDLKISNAQSGTFATNCTIPTALLGQLTLERGWVAVDVKIRGKTFRLISTGLDFTCLQFSPNVQKAQAAEILSGPATTPLPVVLIGDLNSAGDGSGVTYNDLIAAGFRDTVAIAGLSAALTCCQAPDVMNPTSLLSTRVDHVLVRGAFEVLAADVVGDNPGDRTPSGLWPSDHAGVAVKLSIPRH